MLKVYQDGCPMDEAHVFYTATNTFRNPIFEPRTGGPDEVGPESEGVAVHGMPAAAAPVQQWASPEAGGLRAGFERQEVKEEEEEEELEASGGGQQPARFLHKSSSSNSASFNSDQWELSQRWQDFCDNLSLSIRGRLFVMESNFKRRVRAMRKYLDKKMPWILPLMGKSQQQQQQQAKQTKSSEQREKLRAEAKHLGRFHFPEPSSARTLHAQQECLLNRLERIKRERRFRVASHTLDTEGAREAHEEGASIEYIDGSPDSSQLVAAAEDQSAPMLLEERVKPTAFFSSISHSAQLAKSKKSCIVCYERASNIMTLPCEHSDICSDCFIEIIYMAVKHKQYPLRCVLCRQKVERIRCSRRLLLSVIEKKRSR